VTSFPMPSPAMMAKRMTLSTTPPWHLGV